MLKAFILSVSYVLVIKQREKVREYCFCPILSNTRIMRLLAKTVFLAVPVVSIPNKCSEYQQYIGRIARKYNISGVCYWQSYCF